jgi:drug/metabolite transporter (DMT)-like permease
VAENAAVFLTVVALGLGTVSVVTPLTATMPIFVLFLTFAFLRGVERLTTRIVLGTLLIVLGVYLSPRSQAAESPKQMGPYRRSRSPSEKRG